MKKYGILAYPAKHSLSPAMHNAAFKALNIDAEYLIFEIPKEELSAFIDKVRHEPISGLSVSLPYKEEIINFVDEIDEDAKRIGAINTILNKDGKLYGYNTDFVGCNKALKEFVGDLKDKKIVIFGAGGVSRAICYGALKEGAEVFIFNRHEEKAIKIADDFKKIFGEKIHAYPLKEMYKIDKSDIFIQATSIWTLNENMKKEEIEKIFPEEFVNKFDVVMDVIYKPLVTPLLKIANRLGKKIITGDKMLLYQAEKQFELWTGEKAPVEIMRKAF